MRILFDARLLSNQTTGISNYIRNLLNVLLKIKCDNLYTILLRNEIVHRENKDLLELVNSNSNIAFLDVSAIGPINQILTPILLREKNIDIYHYPHFDLPGFMSYSSVITIHDLKYIIKPSFFPELSILKKKYIQTILKKATMVAKEVICVSEATKVDLLNLFSIRDDKVHVVHLGANFINQS